MLELFVSFGALAAVFLLRARAEEGRGWCRWCHAPDLWRVGRPTAASLALSLGAVAALGAAFLFATLESTPAAVAALGLEIALLAGARRFRRRVIRCNTCSKEAVCGN
jgi:hypothetical protein